MNESWANKTGDHNPNTPNAVLHRRLTRRKTVLSASALAATAALGQFAMRAEAQDATPVPGKPAKPWQPPIQDQQVVLPGPDFHYPGTVGLTAAESDPPNFPQPAAPPKGAPNVLLILVDDAGFGQFGTFGGPVPTPAADKLASEGLKYNRFHTTALCSPTRAALITGRNHHSVSFGVVGEIASGYDGYTSIIPKSAATVAEVLQLNGYSTAWFGKNHNVPTWEQSPAGPFDHWPTGLGFDYFYGFVGGEIDQYSPMLWENTTPVTPYLDNPDYSLNQDLADQSIKWIQNVSTFAPDKPWFAYVCPGATHAPHQVSAEWSGKFRGQFDQGWDKLREESFERQKTLGVIPADAMLTPRPAEIPAWDSFPADQQALFSRQAEVFAGFSAQVDYEMGRVIEYARSLPNGDNTLIFYIIGDNGSSGEGGLTGMANDARFFNALPTDINKDMALKDQWGLPTTSPHFAVGWAWAMDTPFQWTKQIASHFGGTRNAMITSWPRQIEQTGGLRSQFHHVIDVMPTILEAAGLAQPTIVNGIAQKPIEGVSMVYTFDDASAPDRRTQQYFEMLGNRAMYQNGWIACSRAIVPWLLTNAAATAAFDPETAPWELYHIDEDFSEYHDLATTEPAKLKDLQDLFWAEAARYDVLPLQWDTTQRLLGQGEWARPSYQAGQTSFTYYPGMIRASPTIAPATYNRSFTVTADASIPNGGAEGALVALGGVEGGWSFTIENDKLVFNYNYLSLALDRIVSDKPLPEGDVKLVADFAYDGGGAGRGATVTLFANDQKIGQGTIDRTVPALFGFDGFDIGSDYGQSVSPNYKAPFLFTGDLESVTVALN